MRSRFLALAATLVAIVATWLGIPAAATAEPVPNVAVGCVYDGHHHSAASMYATNECGPQVLFELSTPELFGSMEEIVAGIRERDRGSSER